MMEKLQQAYTQRAYARLGIDPSDWKPGLGYRYNRDILDALYHYYQQVYLLRPAAFYWMGLARLTGGQVLWGMDNLLMFAGDPCVLTQQIVATAKHIFDNLSWQHELFLDNPPDLLKAVQQLDIDLAHSHAYAKCWQLIESNDAAGIDEGNR